MDTYPADRWAQIDALFAEALEQPPEARLSYVTAACGDDHELLQAVRRLLANEAAAGELLGGFAADVITAHATHDDATAAAPGQIVGPYRLVKEIGRGGMGAVYEARRADGEFEQRVALKLVKRGMDTEEILRRFHFERRILAALEHPNIARLYDGGAAADGRPYLVMELIDGERITNYCDARRLGVDARLELFRSVCMAVQHAHQHLVVHRDIKPSNILVTADGTVKLLDFGIARLVDDADDEAPRTRTGMRILTPDYAAPEQLRGEKVTTASDVFALGAVLYELLAGCRPFPAAEAGDDGAQRGAREARRPSVVVQKPDAAQTAALRSATPERLRRQLQGDLDTIVLKALADEAGQRYQSAQQLLDELDRFLAGMPVTARPAAISYRAGKFVRRHRVALSSAALIMLSLMGGLGVALVQGQRAASERDRAERARAIAEDERDAAEQIAAFLEGMFGAANPFSAQPGRMDTMRIGSFLERGAERVGAEFADRPLVRARMQSVLGRVYRSLGVHERAEPLLTESLDGYRLVHGEQHTDVAAAMNALGNLYLDRERAAEAEALHRRALAIRRELGAGERDVAQSLNNLASALQNSGRLAEAEPLYDEVLDIHRRMEPPDSASYADVLNTRMALAFRRDDIASALPLAREILDINIGLFGEEHPRVTMSMNNLGQILSRTGAFEDAEPLLRRSLELNRAMLGADHPNVAAGAGNLAGVLLKLGRHGEAETLYRESIATTRRQLGGQHPALAVALSNYADVLVERQRPGEAEQLQREALAINRAAFGGRHTNVGVVTSRLATNLCRQGRTQEARALHQEALAVLRANLQARPRPAERRRVGRGRVHRVTGRVPGAPAVPVMYAAAVARAAALTRTDPVVTACRGGSMAP